MFFNIKKLSRLVKTGIVPLPSEVEGEISLTSAKCVLCGNKIFSKKAKELRDSMIFSNKLWS